MDKQKIQSELERRRKDHKEAQEILSQTAAPIEPENLDQIGDTDKARAALNEARNRSSSIADLEQKRKQAQDQAVHCGKCAVREEGLAAAYEADAKKKKALAAKLREDREKHLAAEKAVEEQIKAITPVGGADVAKLQDDLLAAEARDSYVAHKEEHEKLVATVEEIERDVKNLKAKLAEAESDSAEEEPEAPAESEQGSPNESETAEDDGGDEAIGVDETDDSEGDGEAEADEEPVPED